MFKLPISKIKQNHNKEVFNFKRIDNYINFRMMVNKLKNSINSKMLFGIEIKKQNKIEKIKVESFKN